MLRSGSSFSGAFRNRTGPRQQLAGCRLFGPIAVLCCIGLFLPAVRPGESRDARSCLFDGVIPVGLRITDCGDLCDECGECVSGCAGTSEDCLVRFRAGLTQINKSIESHVGGTYGIDGAWPVDDDYGLHWAARINQFSGGTQYLTSLGSYRRSSTCGELADRLGASVIVDVFLDSRVSDLWLSQLRGQVGVATSSTSAVGVAFTTGLNSDRSNLFFVPGNPLGPYTAVDSVAAYVAQELDRWMVQAAVGYRESPNSMYIDAAVRHPLVDDKVFLYASTNYITDDGLWGTWAGVEYRLGGVSRRPRCARQRRRVWDDPVIFNSFNYGENSFWHNTNNLPGGGLPGGINPPPET